MSWIESTARRNQAELLNVASSIEQRTCNSADGSTHARHGEAGTRPRGPREILLHRRWWWHSDDRRSARRQAGRRIGRAGAIAVLRTSPSAVQRLSHWGQGLPVIPERLLLARARGEVRFVVGAGVSQHSWSTGLPRELVLGVYAQLDPPVYGLISNIPRAVCNKWNSDVSG